MDEGAARAVKAMEASAPRWDLMPTVIRSDLNVSRGGLAVHDAVCFHDGGGWQTVAVTRTEHTVADPRHMA